MKIMITEVASAWLLMVLAVGSAQAGAMAGEYNHIGWDQCWGGAGGAHCIQYGEITNIIMVCHTPYDCRLYLEMAY